MQDFFFLFLHSGTSTFTQVLDLSTSTVLPPLELAFFTSLFSLSASLFLMSPPSTKQSTLAATASVFHSRLLFNRFNLSPCWTDAQPYTRHCDIAVTGATEHVLNTSISDAGLGEGWTTVSLLSNQQTSFTVAAIFTSMSSELTLTKTTHHLLHSYHSFEM